MNPADVKKVPIVDGSIAARLVDEGFADYADAYEVAIDPRRFPDADAFARAFVAAPPPWVAGLLRARDAMVSWIGLKTTNGGTVVFQERERADREIVFGEDDKHLDFRVTVLHRGTHVVVSTVVRFHGVLGRAYFLPVAPAHRVIVPAMIRAAAQAQP